MKNLSILQKGGSLEFNEKVNLLLRMNISIVLLETQCICFSLKE